MSELEKLMQEAEDAMHQTITSMVDAAEESADLLGDIFSMSYTKDSTTTEQEKHSLAFEKTAEIFAQCEEYVALCKKHFHQWDSKNIPPKLLHKPKEELREATEGAITEMFMLTGLSKIKSQRIAELMLENL